MKSSPIAPASEPPATRSNLLVISDLHLGEDLSPGASPTAARDLRVAEKNLVDFIRHYTRQRADGLPWRLVVNGDMADFMAICIWPGDTRLGTDSKARRSEDRDHGLGRRADVACIKMADVLERHGDVFAAMARFIAVGNKVDIIVGNHDAELAFPQVQQVLRDSIVASWRALPASASIGGATAESIGKRIEFHPWFVYEPGVAWIEHGHQYDECCSFEYGLSPLDPKTNEIVTNVDFAGLRYLSNGIPELDHHGTEEWSFWGCVRFALGLGVRGTMQMARGYYLFAKNLVAEWQVHRSIKLRRLRRAEHEARLVDLSARSGVPLGTLEALAELRRTPIVSNLGRLVRVLQLHKLLVGAAAILAAIFWFAVLPTWPALAAIVATAAGAQVLVRQLDAGRNVLPSVPLAMMPSRILRHVDARFVVFGHSHDPVAESIGDGRVYFNTGTWLPLMRPGLLRSFTHVVIQHGQQGATAGLYQWRDGASRAFTPGWAPASREPILAQKRLRPASEPRQAA